MAKKLYRSANKEQRVAGGVFEGMGEWLDISPGILRVGFIALALLSGILPAVLLYFAAFFLIEQKPHSEVTDI